jgi:uncharacterized membrane protein
MNSENKPTAAASIPPQPSLPDAKPWYLRPDSLRPEWVFLILAAVTGLFIALVNPPFQAPDEFAHFARVYQLSEGTLISQKNDSQIGGWIPQAICDASLSFPLEQRFAWPPAGKMLWQPFAPEPRHFIEFMHTALYSPVAYAPAILGVWGARLVGLSGLGQFYASRIATLLGSLLIVFFAIRAAPVFQWVIALVALMPMTVFLSASISADAMTNALALLATALILQSSFARNDSVRAREWLAILAACSLLALTKQMYFLISALTFLVPLARFGSWSRKAMLCLGAIGATLIANFAWAFLIRNTITVETWAHPHQQTMFILSHPLQYAAILWHMFSGWGVTYLIWFVGTFGQLNVYLPPWVWPTYIVALLVAACLDQGHGRPLKFAERSLIIAVCAATVLLVATSQYLSYTFVAAKIIRGLQGRYFIPLAVVGLLAFYNRQPKTHRPAFRLLLIAYCAFVLIVTSHTLVHYYYQ